MLIQGLTSLPAISRLCYSTGSYNYPLTCSANNDFYTGSIPRNNPTPKNVEVVYLPTPAPKYIECNICGAPG
jgi:hypothetical protein